MYKQKTYTVGVEAQKAFEMIERQIYKYENMLLIPKDDLTKRMDFIKKIYYREPFCNYKADIFSEFHKRSEYCLHDAYVKVKHACTYLRALCDIFFNMLNDFKKIIENLEFIVDAFGDSLMIPKFNR